MEFFGGGDGRVEGEKMYARSQRSISNPYHAV